MSSLKATSCISLVFPTLSRRLITVNQRDIPPPPHYGDWCHIGNGSVCPKQTYHDSQFLLTSRVVMQHLDSVIYIELIREFKCLYLVNLCTRFL